MSERVGTECDWDLRGVSVDGTSASPTICQISTVLPHPILISVQETFWDIGVKVGWSMTERRGDGGL